MADQGKVLSSGGPSSPSGRGRDDHSGDERGGSGDHLQACYALLQVSPDASLDEISAAYHSLKNTWREDRFAQVDAWQDKAKVKIAEIENAYDTILRTLLDASRGPDGEPELIRDDPPLALAEDERPLQGDDRPAFTGRGRPEILRGLRRRRAIVVALLLALTVVAGVLLLWPAPHRSPSGEVAGGAAPAIEAPPLRPPDGTPVETIPQGSVTLPIPLPVPTGQEQAPGPTRPEPALSASTVAPALSSPPAKRPRPPAAREKAPTGGTYSIQVKAFREEAKAKAFLAELGTRHAGARLQKAAIAGKGVWYRVLVGRYRTRDQALADLKRQGMAEAYPGSFVQKIGKGR